MSRPTWSARIDFGSTLADIVDTSQRNNARDQLSGALLGNESWFVQVLEGPTTALLNAMHRILSDSRHEDVFLFEVAPAANRVFASWTMHCSSLDGLDPDMVWRCVDHFKARSKEGARDAIDLARTATKKVA